MASHLGPPDGAELPAHIGFVRPSPPVRSPRQAVSPRLLASALALALSAGCATVQPKMTGREAGLVDDEVARAADSPTTTPSPGAGVAAGDQDVPLPPPVAVAAPEAVPSEPPEGPPIDPALIRFAAEARQRRLRTRAGAGFPADAAQAWRTLVGELDVYLARPLPQTPLLELVRSEVTLEAEWAYDQRRFGQAPPELAGLVEPRARRLDQRIQAARAIGQSMFVERPPGRLRWPLEHAGLSSPFGLRLHPMTGERQWHAGIDLAAERGRVIGAAGPGYVVRAGWVSGYGMLVEVRHPGELTTRYGHLSAILCTPGDAVEAGQILGLVGQTGLATGPHLHFEVWHGGQPSDPLAWLGGGSRLAGAAGLAASR
jgi:murein DD-endopeptidase MepM/ murein hydrolase activator NlpD